MKNLIRTVLTLMVCLVACSFLSPMVLAETIASGTSGDNLNWTLDNEGTLFISGYGDMTSSDGWSEHIERIKTIVIEQGAAAAAQEAAEQAKDDAEATAESVSQSAAQIETDKQDIGDLKSHLQSFAVGGEKTVTAATADDGKAWGVHQFELYMLEGMTLTVTNNNSNYANISAVPTSGENFSLMRSDGNTTKSVTTTKSIKAIRIYSDVYPINLVFSINGVAEYIKKEDNKLVSLIEENGNKNSKTQKNIEIVSGALQSVVSGANTEFAIDTASKEYMFSFMFLKGITYTLTNSTTLACEIRVRNSDGVQATVGTVASTGRIQYTPDTDDIIEVGGWFNGTGTLDITSAGQIATDSEQNEKIKAVSFNGTFTASDVENNRGYIERYGRFYTSQKWFSTDYIAIPILTKDTDLTIKSTIYTNAGVAFYNSNKECILGIDGNNAADYGFESRYEIISRTITAPKGTAFVRICFYSFEQNAALAENLFISGNFGLNTAINAAAETDARSEINERFDLCRWHDGTVYVTKNGVPQGSGLVIPNAANGRLYDRTLLFEDDFNGAALDTETWEYEIGYKRNNEPQVYQAKNVAVANSNLVITATRENVQAEKDGVLTDFEWTSGSVKCTMPYTYGRVEAKILFPSTVGSFGAFWGIGTVGNYPYCGEIDVIENNPSTSNPNNISCGAYGVVDNTNESFGRRFLKSYDQNGYHIYAVEISETSLEFYVDNDLVSTLDTSDESMSEFRTPYKWLLNLALSPESFGQAYQVPDDVDEYKMYVDWFRFYAPKT